MESENAGEPRNPYEEDARWIETIRRANRTAEKELAYENLLRKHWQGVTVLALQRVGDLRDAEDVAQEAFERAFRSLDNLKEPTAFLGWLLRIASNVATDHIRSRKPLVSLDALGESAASESPRGARNSTPDFEHRIERDDEVATVLDALQHLPDRYREVITLKYLQDLDGRTMSEQLGEPEGTVRNRLFRALEKLREVLASRRSVRSTADAEAKRCAAGSTREGATSRRRETPGKRGPRLVV